jgi:hypothetical protein
VSPPNRQSRREALPAIDIYVGISERLALAAVTRDGLVRSVRTLGWHMTLSFGRHQIFRHAACRYAALHSVAATKICLRRAVWMFPTKAGVGVVHNFTPLKDKALAPPPRRNKTRSYVAANF